MATSEHFSPHTSMNGCISDSALLSMQEVEERIHQLLTENATLRNTLQQNNTYMRQLSVTLIEWQDEVVRVQNTYRNKFEKAKELILKLKEENKELKRKLTSSPVASGAGSTVLTSYASGSQSAPAVVAAAHIQDGSEAFDSYVIVPAPGEPSTTDNEQSTKEQEETLLPSYDSLFNALATNTGPSESDLLANQLQREVSSLRAQLATEMDTNKTKQIMLNQTQAQLDQLMVDYQELSKKVGRESQANLEEALDFSEVESLKATNRQLRQQASELEAELSSVTARLASAEEIAQNKQKRNSELQNEIAKLEKLLETMDILKAQVDVYQVDFEAEREARQNLAGEKEALVQEIRSLKTRLAEASGSSGASAAPSSVSTEQEYTVVGAYSCPKCNFQYATMETLNNHLDVCLTQHMYP